MKIMVTRLQFLFTWPMSVVPHERSVRPMKRIKQMCKWPIVHTLFVDYCWLTKNDNFIWIEDILVCLNSKCKTECLKLPSKYNNSGQILVFYCGNMFQSY
jgi:hypothetical protein